MSRSGPGTSRLGFHLLTLAAVLVCLVAARWQWDRAHRTEAEAVPDLPVVALADLDPSTAFAGMRISVTGTFDAEHQILVAPRERDGQRGAWVLTLLHPSVAESAADRGDTADEVAVAIVRGWVPEGSTAGTPPLGEVTVVGVLVADSREPGVQPTGSPATLSVVDTGAVAAHAGYPVRAGWLALSDLEPATWGQPLALDVGDLPGADLGLNWRNAAYAVQWIVFAGFVAFFWTRFRRELDDRHEEQEISR